ncbi:hypothetical protein [Streptomyces sp. NPDC001781]
MSWLALGGVPGPVMLGGGVLCLAGVAVARSRRRTGPPQVVDAAPGPDRVR